MSKRSSATRRAISAAVRSERAAIVADGFTEEPVTKHAAVSDEQPPMTVRLAPSVDDGRLGIISMRQVPRRCQP